MSASEERAPEGGATAMTDARLAEISERIAGRVAYLKASMKPEVYAKSWYGADVEPLLTEVHRLRRALRAGERWDQSWGVDDVVASPPALRADPEAT